MVRTKRETRELAYYRTVLTMSVHGNLYGSSPTTREGIEAMLKANQPSEAQIAEREGAGMEQVKPMDELASEVAMASLPEMTGATVEEGKTPSTVFRRDRENRPYLHSNYLKGHLREAGEVVSRISGIWGIKDMVTRTVLVCPERNYLEGEVRSLRTFFTPEVRMSTGVMVKQPTEKVAEYVENPIITWALYIANDPRWDEVLMKQLLVYGSMRGLGPGRGVDTSKYTFTMAPWGTVPYLTAMEQYRREFEQGLEE